MSKREIARRAWELYRATVARYPVAATRATVGECFRAAWSESRNSGRAAWEAMSGEEQYTALRRMAWTVKRRAGAKGAIWADWITTRDDAASVAAEAWPDVAAELARRTDAGEPLPLALGLYRATARAARRIHAKEHSHPAEPLDDAQIMTRAAHADPETAALARLAVSDSIAGDPVAATLIAAIRRGYTIREAAAALSMSKSSAQRLLDRIRRRISEAIAD